MDSNPSPLRFLVRNSNRYLPPSFVSANLRLKEWFPNDLEFTHRNKEMHFSTVSYLWATFPGSALLAKHTGITIDTARFRRAPAFWCVGRLLPSKTLRDLRSSFPSLWSRRLSAGHEIRLCHSGHDQLRRPHRRRDGSGGSAGEDLAPSCPLSFPAFPDFGRRR